ncbi:YdbH domain-containing protein [Shewanella avicenniae]|uniref:YdbH domain-containing protein n=1 Tax=Shewanella avicenniae TaxID=2814294 RepID=A0ABX7QU28_9GAMM|nr:YdbH domain-containing protein [Shewanella avicenniae]QSX34992.1 YdbH domain-containing protein [Shewanella avicenniae]
MRRLKRTLVWFSASILIVLALLCALLGYLWQQPAWLVPQLNQYLAPYQLQFSQLQWRIANNRTLEFPALTFSYAGNQLSFEQVSLSLKQPLTLTQLWDWYQLPSAQRYQQLSQAMAAIRYQSATVSVPVTQLLPSDSTEPLWLPLVGDIPELDFGVTQIKLLPDANAADQNANSGFALQLSRLQLAKDGEFHTELSSNHVDSPPLLRLDGELPTADLANAIWQLETKLSFNTLYQLQQQLNDAGLQPLVAAYPWLASNWPLASMQAGGELSAKLQLTIKNGALDAAVCWRDPVVRFPDAENSSLLLTGNSTAAQVVDNCPTQALAMRYQATDNQSRLTLAPLQLALLLTSQQRQAWSQLLAVSDDTQRQLSNTLKRLQQQVHINDASVSESDAELGLTVDLNQGLTLNTFDAGELRATIPALKLSPRVFDWFNQQQLQLKLTNTELALAAPFSAEALTTQAALAFSSDWQLLLALPQGIRVDDANWSASSRAANIALAGEVKWTGDNQQASLTLSPAAQVTLAQLTAKVGDKQLSANNFNASQRQQATVLWQNGKLSVSLPATDNQLRQITGELPPYQLSVNQLDVGLPALQNISLDTRQPLWPQLQQQTAKGQFSVSASQPHLAQRKQTRLGMQQQSLINLRTLQLLQQLDWQHGQLHSVEQWQVDDVTLHSQHHFSPSADGYQINADWQLQTPLATLQQIAAKNMQWQPDWQLNGISSLSAKVALQQRAQQLTLDVTMQPKLSDANGHYQQMPFSGLSLQAACRYQLSVTPANVDTSQIGCQQVSLHADSFNPGIALSQIDINGSGDFTPSAPAEIRDSWLLPGFSAAVLQLDASAQALNGTMTIPDFNFDLNGQSSGYLLVRGMDIEQLLQQHPQQSISATGVFDGVLPLTIADRKVAITGGHLAARYPGVIEVHNTPAIAQMRANQAYLDYVLDFLQQLQYEEILGQLDMADSGDAHIQLSIKGHGQGIERPVHLNYSHEENLLQLLQSLTIGEKLQTGLEASMQ